MISLKKNKIYSKLKSIEKNKYAHECIKICLIYAVIGSCWVFISDKLAHIFASDNHVLLIISMCKGWLYVAVTSVILYLLINSLISKINSSEMKLNESYEELSASNEELQAYAQELAASQEQLRAQYDQITDSEKKLSISEGKNRAIIKAMPDLLFVIDNNGYFIDCIANDESLLLMPKEAFIGKTLCEVIPEEISETACEKMQSVLTNSVIEKFEYKLNISGEDLYFELRMVKNSENEILAISRNITSEKQNERNLRISEERYRTLINEMQQGVALYEGSCDGEDATNYSLLNANESHEKLMGLKTKDILGKTLGQLFGGLGEEVISKLNCAAKTGISQHYQHYFPNTDKYYEVTAYRPKRLQLAVIVNDITSRKKAEKALVTSEFNFRNIFENSSDAILITEDNKVIDCNLAMIELLGFDSKKSILGKAPEVYSPEKQPGGEFSREKASQMYELAVKNGKCKFEWWYKKTDGSLSPVEVMMTTIIINGKKAFHSLWRDISDRKKMEDRLEYLSYHDQLTGLYNRRFFEEELLRMDIESSLPLTIIMADVNGLKLVNDSFGHAAGDELLRKVAKVMENGFRKNDIIARLGGDEFVVLLPYTDIDDAKQIIRNIKNMALKEKAGTVDVSISFGYSTKTAREDKIQDILKKAEDYMYKEKLFEGPSMRGKTINTIISTLHEKNKREEQHSHRVSSLCESMGRALDLSEDDIKELKTVGLLHDIGKIAIEENILNKPGKLTEEEWVEIKKHPEIGYRILRTVSEMSEMAEHVLAHHERFDGKGYPKGLKGEQIPLQSRIIAIADSYDAMVSERSYRNALPEEVAVKELQSNTGSQFDPELTKVFIEKVLNGGDGYYKNGKNW